MLIAQAHVIKYSNQSLFISQLRQLAVILDLWFYIRLYRKSQFTWFDLKSYLSLRD